MDVSGGYTLTDDQEAAWMDAYPAEYAEYIDAGLYDEDSNLLLDIPEWMNDGDATNGPFDFSLNPSHGTAGW